MVLVDTNILAYLLIDGDHTAKARRLHSRDADWRSEAFLLVEFCNVLLRYMQVRGMKLTAARGFLSQAEMVLDGKLTRVPHWSSLEIASRFGVTAYDARFLVVAEQLDLRLITEDVKLRAAAPALTQSLDEALATT